MCPNSKPSPPLHRKKLHHRPVQSSQLFPQAWVLPITPASSRASKIEQAHKENLVMSINFSKWCVVPAVLLLGSVALAQDPSSSGSSTQGSSTTTSTPAKQPTVAQRKENQQDRIANGVKSGQLTAGETANLESKEAAINGETRADRAANGGKLTTAEKAQVNKQQNQVSKQIYSDK